ncbi:putative nuclease HARBI1 [Haliotis rubra]|uniref:putative nuclease HARBI1 n=1 Tax=Haliotis rubra TaxID=36100 RepID=UPI001EE5AEA2|nr:putative nuclease HARBI1 [Haliotis rubra]
MKLEKSLRKQRVFRDRTIQLETLTDLELISRYRLTREAIFCLVDKVRPMVERPTQRSHAMTVESQVLLTLRYLGKGGFLSEIGDLHGLDKSSVSRGFHCTVNAICTVLDNITFPWSLEQQTKVKQDFYRVGHFPKVLGAVDGTLIPIKRPSPNEEAAYVCRKGYHAINVQAICDSSLRFTNVVAKWPGSTHDSLIWSNSQVGMKMEETAPDGWLLGDSGYACRPWMLTPLADPQTKPEQRYNAAHIRTRNTVERAFGVLKSRFRCLHKSTGCLWFSPQRCVAVIMAAFKLHNFCIDKNIAPPPEDTDMEVDHATGENCPVSSQDGCSTRRKLIAERFT